MAIKLRGPAPQPVQNQQLSQLLVWPVVCGPLFHVVSGASDAAEEGNWTWVNGDVFAFQLWAATRPSTTTGNTLDYAEISGGAASEVGKWYDRSNSTVRDGYILELGYPTSPTDPDSDDDGLTDFEEFTFTKTNAIVGDSDSDGTLDAVDDQDGDGLSNLAEIRTYATNPMSFDTDSDGLGDRDELTVYGTNPALADTDSDGFDDLYEINTGFVPTLASSSPESVSSIRAAFDSDPDAVEFGFNAAKGANYRIEGSADLLTWTTLETGIMGAGSIVSRLYRIEGYPKRYFRACRN